MGTDRVTHWGRHELPLVIAHRGASADAPENTLSAFRRARSDGADGVELDVMRCGSGEVVVFHDDDLLRLGKRSGLTRQTPLAALREIDLGGGERIPTLDEALEALDPMLINIELKSTSKLRDDGLAASVAELLARHDTGARALVSSFDPWLLARFARRAPAIATGLLFAHDQSLPLRRAWSARVLRPTALHPESLLVDAASVRRWRARGFAVNVWTVDDPAELRLFVALGVDGVITNRPKNTRAVIQS